MSSFRYDRDHESVRASRIRRVLHSERILGQQQREHRLGLEQRQELTQTHAGPLCEGQEGVGGDLCVVL